MTTTLSDLKVAYESNVASAAKADAAALNSAGDAAEVLDKKITATTKSGASFVNRWDDVTKTAKAAQRAQSDLQKAQDALNKSVAEGAVTSDQAARTLKTLEDRVTSANEKHEAAVDAQQKLEQATSGATNAVTRNTSAVKLQSYQVAQVADEFHKWVDQVLAGGSALTATTYQLPNMVQAMGGVGNATKLVTGFLSGPGGLVLAAGAAGLSLYKMASYAESQSQELATLSQHLRATRTDYMDMAASIESVSKTMAGGDLGDAGSSILKELASVPTVDSSQFQRLSHDVLDLATVMGTDATSAAKSLSVALADPAKAAQQFADDGLPGFNAGLVLSIQHMQQAGDQSGALSTTLGTLEHAIQHAHDDAMTPFQKAWDDLGKEFGVTKASAATAAQGIGQLIDGMATAGIHALTDLVKEIKEIPDALSSAWSAVQSGVSWVGSKLESGVEALVPSDLAATMRRGSSPDPVFAMPDRSGASSGSDSWNYRQASNMVDTVAAEQNLGSDLTSLMHLIQSAESSTGQYHNGQLVTSSAGAIGALQVMSSNAAGYDLTDLHGNESAAAKYLKQLYAKYDGDQTLVAMAYNWGPGNVDHWLANGSNPDTIPQETQDYIAKTTEGASYGATAAASLQKSVDAYTSKGDAGVSGQRDDLERTYQGEAAALQDLNKQYAAGLVSYQQYADGSKALHSQMDDTRASIANLRDPLQQLAHDQDNAAQSSAALTGYQRQMVSVAQQVDQAQLSMNGTHASAATVLSAQERAQAALTGQWDASVSSISRQANGLDKVNASYIQNAQSLDHVTNYQRAYEEALASFDPKSADFTKHVDDMTDALDRQTAAQHEQQLIGQTWANNDQISVLQTETATIGMNDDARQKLIARMQAEQTLLRSGASLTDATSKAYLESVDALSEATSAYQHQQQVMSDLTGSIEGMTSQLSDGLVQGFLQGTSSGMSFKSTIQGIETQVVSMIAKLSLIDPVLNEIDGGSRSTLSDITGLFDKMGSASSADTFDWGSAGNASDFSGAGISVGQALNLKNSLSSSGASSSMGSGSWLQSVLGTKLGGVTTVGSALGGIGAGMALGNMTGSLGGDSTAGTIGSLVGTALGAGVGSIIPGVGTIIGGAIGGGLGGLASLFSGLFATKHKNWDAVSAGSDGMLSIGSVYTKHSADTVSGPLQDQLDALNSFMGLNDVGFDAGNLGSVGFTKKGKKVKSQTELYQLLGKDSLHSSDANMQEAITDLMPSSFDSVDSWTSTVSSLKTLADTMDSMGAVVSKFNDSTHVTVSSFTGYTGDMAKALSTLDNQTMSVDDLQSKFSAISEFVGTTLPGLLDVTASGSESLMQQVDDLQKKYQDAATTAASYGLDAQALLDKGNAIASMMIANENTTLSQADQSVQARYMAATGDQQGADLLNFDVSAAQQTTQLEENWRGYLGDTYASNADFQAQMADLDKTLAAERLEIQQNYADQALTAQKQYESQANSSVASVFSNLADYAQGLSTSDASPLSVQDQYGVANDNLHSDYSLAMGGDYDALSRLQSDSQAFLTDAKAWFGSGTGYSDAYKDVLTMLQSVGSVGSDDFTASLAKTLAAQQTDATFQVKAAVQSMHAAVVAELKQWSRIQSVRAA